ncbi:MAG TPA: hypothetical protein VGI98_05535, partial [Candidatus Limnocylindrales bacterium]
DISGQGVHTLDCTVQDAAGNTSSSAGDTMKIDSVKPSASIAVSAGTLGNNGWYTSDVTIQTSGTDATSGIASCTTDQSQTTDTTGADFFGSCTDSAGNVGDASPSPLTIKRDATAPTLSLSHTADGANGWNVTDPAAEALTAADTTSGVDVSTFNCTDSLSGFGAVTGSSSPYAADISGQGVHTLDCTVQDAAGNTSSSAGDTMKIDSVKPSASIVTPANNASYILNALVVASYTCSDATSGVAGGSCNGPVVNGGDIDTTIGAHVFTVTVTDNAGNTNAATSNYTVKYAACYLYDPTKSYKAGSTAPIKFFLCDANGLDVSSAGTVVQAVSLTRQDNSAAGSLEDSGYANPDNNFRFDTTLGPLGGYIFNLSTKSPSPALGQKTSLATGTWLLNFTVGGVSGYSVRFDVR